MNHFNTSQTLGDIVSIMPKAGEIFKKSGIDFCCGGKRPLSAAIGEKNLDEREILDKLDDEYEKMKNTQAAVDFRKVSLAELIDHILNTHHVYVKKTLPELGDLAVTILNAHGKNHKELFMVHKLFSNLKTDLEQHLIKEETVIFPMIIEYEKHPSKALLSEINKWVKETEDEHEAAGQVLKELRKITADYNIPDDVCMTFERTYKKLEELESDLFQHIHLENNIMFKKLNAS